MKGDLLYVEHVVETIDVIFSYIGSVSFEGFLNNNMLCDAVMRNLQILSESTQKISTITKDKYPDVPWRDMAGFRNILVHDYIDGVDLRMVWNVIINDLPELRAAFLKIRDDVKR
ncbi:MAG: DUF86 domain-containing protein [Holosporales bacterium]|jgi:uncharacterized protein with HEPN domain|nr:DUF86 domain-containing protein [Holosporales bacterium]